MMFVLVRKFAYSLLLSFLTALSSYGQDTTVSSLSEVVITAERRPQHRFLIPYSVAIVSKTTIDNFQPRSTPEALTGITGVFVQKTNHGGGSPFVRGLTGNQTLLMVDGIRMNNSTFRYGPNQYFNTIDVFTIDKIEVVKGTGSVQYGSDAMGGVLQVFTSDPAFASGKAGWSGRATGKYMTGDMEKTVRGEAGYHAKKYAVQLGATYKKFGDLVGGDTTGRQSPSGYDELSFDIKSKILLSPATRLTLAHQFLKQDDVPVYHKVKLEDFAVNAFRPQQRMLSYAKLQQQTGNKIFSEIEYIASWQQTLEGRESRKNGSAILTEEKDIVNTLGLTADIRSRFTDSWTANSGVELYVDQLSSSRTDTDLQRGDKKSLRGLYPDQSTYKNFSLYSLQHIDLNKWLIEGGLRLNSFDIHVRDTSLGNVNIRPVALVYNASLMYKLTSSDHLYVSVSSGFRAPNIDDMGTLGIVDFRYEVPTKDLKPESSRNYEIGYKMQRKKVSAAFSAYYMQLKNLITRIKMEGEVISGYPVYQKENTDNSYIKGFESEISFRPVESLLFNGNIAYNYGENINRKEPLRRIPPMHGRLLGGYEKNNWFLSAEWLFASRQDRLAQGDKDDNRIPKGGTPGWMVYNLHSSYRTKHVAVSLAFLNLLNEDYRTHGSGINGVGRSACLSVSLML